MGNDFTLVAIDMPFHGQTEWNEGLLFTVNDLINIIDEIRSIHHATNRSTFSLLGYSMGGRIALQLLEKIPANIERIVLVAPDGLHKNFWYTVSTQTILGNKLFSYTMRKPGKMFATMKLAEKTKLLHQSIIKVAHYYLDEPDERIKLYERWTTMRTFKPHLLKLKKIISEHKIPVRFLFGRYDGIILSKRSDIFKDDVQNVYIAVIDAGHRMMQEKYADVIAKMFYQ